MHADVLVVGGGIAGLVAAARAGELGLKAIVLEQGISPDYPCNSRVTGGIVHFAREGMMEPPDVLRKKALSMTGGFVNSDLIGILAGDARRAIDWLRSKNARFTRIGKQLHYEWVMAPLRVARPGLDPAGWKGRAGDALLKLLTETITRQGGQLVMATKARRLIMDQGQCVGVEAIRAGETVEFRSRAVVLADGGFQANEDLVRRFISPQPEKLLRRNAGTGQGDALRMMEEAGAGFTGMKYFYGHLHSRDAMQKDDLWPYPALDSIAVAGIVVNGRGERFADEGRGGVYLSNAIAWSDDPLDAWVIFDEDIWNGPGKGELFFISANPRLSAAGGTIVKADTLEELEARAGFRAGSVSATVAKFNDAVDRKSCAELQPGRSTETNTPSPIRKKPFYAVPLCSGLTFTMGGATTDADMRVLRTDGSAIPGLFAAGKSLGGLEGGEPVGYVGGLSLPVITGLRAAEFIARSTSSPAR